MTTNPPLRSALAFADLRASNDNSALLVLRRAVAWEQAAITQLVRRERLNPTRLDWPNFIVAVAGDSLVGAVQMRRHGDGSRELGSLVVHPDHRGRGLAARLIAALLARHDAPVHLVTRRSAAVHYERWGFRPIAAVRAPRAVLRNYCLGQLASRVALLRRQRPRRLVILQRG